MILGILLCDTLADVLPPEQTPYDELFRKLILSVRPDARFRVYDVRSFVGPADPAECDAYIVTGSLSAAYDEEPWIRFCVKKMRDLHAAGAILVGVCFGHQLIAQAFGGRVERSPKGWCVGVHTYARRDESRAGGEGSPITLLHSHQDIVTELPDGAEVIAGDEFCVNAAYRIGDTVISFQGHPEFTGRTAEYMLDCAVYQGLTTEATRRAYASLSTPTNHVEIAEQICAFVEARASDRV